MIISNAPDEIPVLHLLLLRAWRFILCLLVEFDFKVDFVRCDCFLNNAKDFKVVYFFFLLWT